MFAGLLAVSLAGGANGGSTLTRSRANAVAMRVLRPQADRGNVILFGLPQPLPKGTFVVPADPPKAGPGKTARVRIRRLSSPAWLFWLDREPEAAFSHPSEYLLVDDADGRVLMRAKVGWYPAVNGKAPPFVATRAGYLSPRYRLFSRFPQRRTSSAAVAASTHERRSVTPAGAFKDDCVLMIGDYAGWHFENDYPALEKWAKSVNLRTFYATPSGPATNKPANAPTDNDDLSANVKQLVEKQGCKDVFIYLAGHGSKDSDVPFVATGETVIGPSRGPGDVDTLTHGITSAGIEKALRAFSTTTFKLKIMSCYAGRFLDALTTKGKLRFDNLLIVEVSSPRDSPSFAAAERHPNNPDKVSWFMNQNLTGLRTWASSENEVASSVALGGSLLARGLERAFVLGRDANAAIREHSVEPLMTVSDAATAIGDGLPNVTVKTYALSSDFKQPWQVAWVGNGSETGAIVFTDRGGNQVGAIDPTTGQTTKFALKGITALNPVAVIDDHRYAVGGKGGVAIFDRSGAGSIRELQMADTQVSSLSVGPDGALWASNIFNGQVISIREPYRGQVDITKLGPYPGCRPTGIVPGVNDFVLICQQSNDVLRLSRASGAEIRRVPLPDANAGAQEARRTPDGGFTFSGFGNDHLYTFGLNDRVGFAPTGAGPAVPLVTGLGMTYDALYKKRPGSFNVFVPHYKAGGFTLATFPAGTSRQFKTLAGKNLVGSAHGPGCSILVADATPGKPAIHQLQFTYPETKSRLKICLRTAAPDLVARLAMPFFRENPKGPAPKTLQVSITGSSSDPRHVGATFAENFGLSAKVTATISGGATYRPTLKVTDTGPYTRLVRITNIRSQTRGMILTVTSTSEPGRPPSVPNSFQINVAALY